MKILVATNETQGRRENDFFWCEPGEIVKFGFECDGETIDGKCGCKRSMSGIKSFKATTTMKVVDMDITKEELKKQLIESDKKAGWNMTEDFIEEEMEELLRIADTFEVGMIVEKRGEFRERITHGR